MIKALPTRPTAGDDEQDQTFAAVQQLTDSIRFPDPLLSHRIRAIVLTDRDIPGERERIKRIRDALVHTLVARTMGLHEVGADALVDSLTTLGMVPAQSAAAVNASMRADELAGRELTVEIDLTENARRVTGASDIELCQARDTARTVLSFAGLLQMLRWAAPDDTSLDAAETTYHRYGMGLFLQAGLGAAKPEVIAPAIMSMLDRTCATLAHTMLDELGHHPFGDTAAQLDGMMKNLQAAAHRGP